MFRPGKKAIIIGVSVQFTTLLLLLSLASLIQHFVPMDPALVKSLPILAASQCVIGFPLILVIFTVFVVRPAIKKTLRLRPEGKPVGENYFVCVLLLVLAYIFTAEIIGQHFLFGALLLGMAIPEGPPLGSALIKKLHYPVGKVLYPVFLTTSGLKKDIFTIHFKTIWIVSLLVLFGVQVKVGAMMVISRYTGLTIHDSIIIGLMMNARGICDVVFFNLWRVSEALSEEHFAAAIMISVIAVMVIITPLIRFLLRALELQTPTKRRTLQHSRPDTELRTLLFCFVNF